MRTFERRPQFDHFISIAGTAILLSEFRRIWNGEQFLPTLTKNELTPYTDIHIENQKPLAQLTLGDTPSFLQGSGKRLKTIKYNKIRKAIETFRASSIGENESLKRAVAKLQNHPINRDEIGYELASDTRETELSQEDIEIIVQSINEVNNLTDGKSNKLARPVSPITSRPIHNLINEQREIMERELGMNLSKIPIAVIERALYQQGMDKDELYELSLMNNIGSAKIVDVINTTRYLMFVGGLLGMAAVFLYPHSFTMEDLEQAFYLATSGATITALYPSGARRQKVKMESSISRYKKLFNTLQRNVEQLSATKFGKVKLALFKEIVTQGNAPVQIQMVTDTLFSFIDQLESNPKRLELFESWSDGENIEDFNDPMDTYRLVKAFLEFEKTVDSPQLIEAPTEEEEEEYTPHFVSATVEKN